MIGLTETVHLQMQLGEFVVDLNGGGLSALVDESTLVNLDRIYKSLRQIGGLFLENKSLSHLRRDAFKDLESVNSSSKALLNDSNLGE